MSKIRSSTVDSYTSEHTWWSSQLNEDNALDQLTLTLVVRLLTGHGVSPRALLQELPRQVLSRPIQSSTKIGRQPRSG